MRHPDRTGVWIIWGVSIHASVKDATYQTLPTDFRNSFNPRICKRCDIIKSTWQYLNLGFNPRICKRCDLLGGGRADQG